jgi:hypothetical protein
VLFAEVRQKIVEEIGLLTAERAELALAAAEGDAAAGKKLDGLRPKLALLGERLDELEVAEALRLQRDAEAEAAAQIERARQAHERARSQQAPVLEAAAAIDAACAQLTIAVRRYFAAAHDARESAGEAFGAAGIGRVPQVALYFSDVEFTRFARATHVDSLFNRGLGGAFGIDLSDEKLQQNIFRRAAEEKSAAMLQGLRGIE